MSGDGLSDSLPRLRPLDDGVVKPRLETDLKGPFYEFRNFKYGFATTVQYLRRKSGLDFMRDFVERLHF